MTKEELYDIAADAVNDSELKSGEIPAIDLYVDQIINLISSKLEQGSERYRDRQLTKTMINNYSKDGIIMPVKGKKYTKEQVIQILCVYSLKSTLSIGEIKRLLYGAYSSEGFGEADLVRLYDRHQDIKQENRDYARRLLDEIMDNNSLDVSDDSDYISTVCALISLSAHLKSIAQAMIDEKFPVPVEEEEEEKEKDKEKEKKKEEKAKEKAKEKEKKKKKDDTAEAESGGTDE
ncbi:MAG: DUF1836 domain-containing protein [Clostridia bacterium]|nr:DUF1836 domain-containing protein [Clostridia bacterium]